MQFSSNQTAYSKFSLVAHTLDAREGVGGIIVCPPVIDPLTYIAFLGFIALATYFLNQFIAMSMIEMASGRKKRESNEKEVSPLNEMSGFILMGMLQIIF